MGGAVGAALRRAGHRVVQIQNPRLSPKKFDLVIANPHDEITGANIIIVRTALHRATQPRLHAARLAWLPRFSHLPRPLVAVLVGGSNGRFRLEAAEGEALSRDLAGIIHRDKAGLMISPSRRTAPEVREALTAAPGPARRVDMGHGGREPVFSACWLART